MDHHEIVRLYGPWRSHAPTDAVRLLKHYPGRWWIAGGWAIEAFTGVSRYHGDLDISIPRHDFPLLRAHLEETLDIWAADRGTLRPLIGVDPEIPSTCSNLWLRASGAEPWDYDVILMGIVSDVWTYKRDPRISLPFDQILWEKQGIRYLRPEIQLLHKAPGLRPQDQEDFDACLPLLTPEAAFWLRAALELAHPNHPWISVLAQRLQCTIDRAD